MTCPKCSAENVPGSLFCAVCGTALEEPAQNDAAVESAATLSDSSEPAAFNFNDPYSQPTSNPAYGVPAYGTPAYGAPAYGTPAYGAPTGDSSKNWAGIAGMICGIGSILLCCTIIGGIVLSIVSVILGVIGLKSAKKGMAIAGIICGALGLVASVAMILIMASPAYADMYQQVLEQYEQATRVFF